MSASSGNVDFGVVVVVVVVVVVAAAAAAVVAVAVGKVDFVMVATDRLENGSIVFSMSTRCCSSHSRVAVPVKSVFGGTLNPCAPS